MAKILLVMITIRFNSGESPKLNLAAKDGAVSEWFMEAVLKTVRAQAHVGSNPTCSSMLEKHNWLCTALVMRLLRVRISSLAPLIINAWKAKGL